MKLSAVLILALLGLASAIKYPLSYEYDYRGEVKTGVPELRHQYSGSAIRAKILVSVVSSSEAVVQIKNPEAAVMNGDVPSYGRAPLPTSSMQPMADKRALEVPFKVHFSGQQEKLEVPANDLLWMSNLRKSIVSMVRIPFVLSSPVQSILNTEENRIIDQHEYPSSFQKREDTLYGKCSVLYTLTKAAPQLERELQQLEQDAQAPQQQQYGNSRDSSVYRMLRSIDFSDCQETVVLKRSSHGNASEFGTGQLRGMQSRSSVGEYILSGEPSTQASSMRIEQAILEGSVTLNPFGHETKKLMTVTNQTLSLVRTTKTVLVSATQDQLKQETFAYRVESPYRRGSNSPSWVSYQQKEDYTTPFYPESELTGFKLTQSLRQQLKQEIKNEVEKVTEQMMKSNSYHRSQFGGTEDGAAAQRLESVSSRLRALTVSDIEELYTELIQPGQQESSQPRQQIKSQLALSALKASGSPAAIKVIVQKMKSKQLSELQSAVFFVTLNVNVASPSSIRELVDYVTSIPEDSSVALKSSALINLSTLIRRMCLNPSVKSYSSPAELLGENQCDESEIRSKYIPYLQNKVKSTQETYLKAIYIQALANLGDRQTVRTLGKIAKGEEIRAPTPLRIQAIQGLTKNHMQNTSYNVAQEILLSIAEEQVQKPVIREAAISSLLSLPKNATFWQRMALSTWREPSRRVASFIYSAIKQTADSKNSHYIDQISMAKHVLPQAKPQPLSPYYSHMFKASAYNTHEDLGALFEGSYLAGEQSMVPQQVMLHAKSVFGGMKYPFVHMTAISSSVDRSLRSILDKFMGGQQQQEQPIRSSQNRRASSEYEQAAEGHRVQSESEEKALLLHLTLLKQMEIFSPITPQSVQQLNDRRKSILGSAIQQLVDGKSVQGATYYSPLQVTEVMPLDIGLPLITQLSKPTMIFSQIQDPSVKTSSSSHNPTDILRSPSVQITGRAITKLIQKTESSVKVLLPYVNQTIVAGIDGETTFSLPAKFSINLNLQSPSLKQFQFTIEPETSEKSPVMYTRNLPFTLVRKLFPTYDVSEQENLKPVNVIGNQPRYQKSMPVGKPVTGFRTDVDYKGDTELPNIANLKLQIYEPLRIVKTIIGSTSRQYSLALTLSPQQSESKKFTATFNYAPMRNTVSVSQPSETVSKISGLSVDDSIQQRLQKLSQSQTPVSSMLSASFNFTGPQSQPRQFEAVYVKFQTQGLPQQYQQSQTKFQVNLMRSPLPGRSSEPAQLCFPALVEMPRFTIESSLQQILESNSDAKIKSAIYGGQQCSESEKLFTVEGKRSLSDERKQYLKRVQTEEAPQPLDTTQAVKTTPVYDQVYVEFKQVQKPLSPILKNLTVHASDILHGTLFPLMSHNAVNVQGQPGLIKVSGTRSLATDRYTIWIHREKSICLIQDMKVPAILDAISPLNNYLAKAVYYHQQSQQSQQSQRKLSSVTGDLCLVRPQHVKTFAGVQYEKKPMQCSTIAVMTKEVAGQDFIVLTKENQESSSAPQEVKIISRSNGYVIKISPQGIELNGDKILPSQKNHKPQVQGLSEVYFHQSAQRKAVQIVDKLQVTLDQEKNDVQIKLDPRFRSQVQGTCGNYGADKLGDLVDSKQCLYSKVMGKPYAASWIATSEVEQCKQVSSSAVKEVINEAKIYQESCATTLQQLAGKRFPRRG